MKCSVCGCEFVPFNYLVEMNGEYFCETCFFDIAIKKLNAKSVKLDFYGEIDEDYNNTDSNEVEE